MSVAFRETLRPLAIAPLVGLAVLMISVASQSGARILFYALFVAPFCYAAATVFVLPIFWFVPRARQPSLVVGAIWGGLAA